MQWWGICSGVLIVHIPTGPDAGTLFVSQIQPFGRRRQRCAAGGEARIQHCQLRGAHRGRSRQSHAAASGACSLLAYWTVCRTRSNVMLFCNLQAFELAHRSICAGTATKSTESIAHICRLLASVHYAGACYRACAQAAVRCVWSARAYCAYVHLSVHMPCICAGRHRWWRWAMPIPQSL